jgi:hypothetical protein
MAGLWSPNVKVPFDAAPWANVLGMDVTNGTFSKKWNCTYQVDSKQATT